MALAARTHVVRAGRAFRALDYRVDAVVGLIGEEAHAALGRNSTVPAVAGAGRPRRPAGHADPAVAAAAAGAAYRRWSGRCPGWSSRWSTAGILAADGDQVRAR